MGSYIHLATNDVQISVSALWLFYVGCTSSLDLTRAQRPMVIDSLYMVDMYQKTFSVLSVIVLQCNASQ